MKGKEKIRFQKKADEAMIREMMELYTMVPPRGKLNFSKRAYHKIESPSNKG